MKKIYFIFSLLLLCGTTLVRTNAQPLTGAWVQDFIGGDVSDGWIISNPGTTSAYQVWKQSSLWPIAGVGLKYKGANMIWFDSYSPSAERAGELISPTFIPGKYTHTLQYTVEEYVRAANYVKPAGLGPRIFLEISTDGGETYTESTFNILTQIPNHNVKPAANNTSLDTLDFTLDLSDYIDQEITVRFRAVSDCGGINVILWKVELLDTSPSYLTELDETFAEGLPEGWTKGTSWNAHTPDNVPGIWVAALHGMESPDKTFMFFETFTGGKGKEGSLETPLIMPTEDLWMLSYDVAKARRSSGNLNDEFYVEVSTDGGETYTASTNDLSRKMELHEKGPLVMKKMYVDLEEYVGTPIKVRFRGVRPLNGGTYFILDSVKLIEIPAEPILTLESVKTNYTQIPISHTADISYTISMENLGYPVRSGAGKIKVETAPAAYQGERDMSPVGYQEKGETSVSGVTIDKPGKMTVNFSAELTGFSGTIDPVSTSIEVTERTFAVDNGTLVGNGVGVDGGGFSFGNLFVLPKDEIIGSFQIGWGKGDAESFKINIYKDEGTRLSLVHSTEEFEKPEINTGNAGTFMQYRLADPVELAAGRYVFAVNQIADANIGLGTDGAADGIVYMVNSNGQHSLHYDFGYALLRIEIAYLDVISLTPENGTQGVARDAEVMVRFNLPVEGELNNVTINGQAVAATVEEEKTIKIEHTQFDYNTEYTVLIPRGAITGYDQDITWTFKTEKAPFAWTSVTPPDGATNVAVDAAVTVTFNDEVSGPLEGIKINNKTLNATAEGNTVTIAHSDFDYDTDYTVTIPVGAITGYGEVITWSFKTLKSTQEFSSCTPENDATGVARNAIVSATFSENVKGSLQGITINDKTANASAEGKIVTVSHSDFDYDTEYTVVIPVGAITGYSKEISWSFRTEKKPLEWIAVTPEDNATNVAVDAVVSVTFSEDISGSLQGITINNKAANASTNGKIVTISHSDFDYNTEYTVVIPADAITGYSKEISWSFRTGQNSLEWVAVTPEDKATEVAVDAVVSVTFSEEINGELQGITINGAAVSAAIDGKVLILSHAAFEYKTKYTVIIPAGAITGYGKEISWSFTTIDEVSIPSVSAGIKVYPTLTSGNLCIETEAPAKVKIVDLTGRVLNSYTTSGDLNITLDYPSGMYLVLIKVDNVTHVRKIILKK